ncbi:hypothetical protein B0H14DRAFT_2818071, partial [Mycena olivaceomarginata]
MVEFLLENNKYVVGSNEVLGGDYGTALCAACANGHTEVVRALLGAEARLNIKGQPFGAPLHVAVLVEDMDMVKLLIDLNLNDANCEWEGVGTAVDVAGLIKNQRLFELLWEMGLRPVSTAATMPLPHA